MKLRIVGWGKGISNDIDAGRGGVSNALHIVGGFKLSDHPHAHTERLVYCDHQLPGIVGRHIVEDEDHAVLGEEAVLKIRWDQQRKEGLCNVSLECRGRDRALNELGDQFGLTLLNFHFGAGSV